MSTYSVERLECQDEEFARYPAGKGEATKDHKPRAEAYRDDWQLCLGLFEEDEAGPGGPG